MTYQLTTANLSSLFSWYEISNCIPGILFPFVRIWQVKRRNMLSLDGSLRRRFSLNTYADCQTLLCPFLCFYGLDTLNPVMGLHQDCNYPSFSSTLMKGFFLQQITAFGSSKFPVITTWCCFSHTMHLIWEAGVSFYLNWETLNVMADEVTYILL
jgi:hypothetical protein